MAARTIVVRLTLPQARAVCSALGFALAGPAEDVFPTGAGRTYQAARRAHAAVSGALDEVGGWEPSPLELARAAAERAGIDPTLIREREDGGLVIDVPLGTIDASTSQEVVR